MTSAQSGTAVPFVLVPGFWLGGWAWDRVAPHLEAAGHPVARVDLPGLGSAGEDRSRIGLEDHVEAVVEALRSTGGGVLVGHSGAGRPVYGATDRVPELVHRAVYVDSGPMPDGSAFDADVPAELTEIPLPSWAELAESGAATDGLTDADLAEFRARALPQPAGVARDVLHLRDPRRRQVPVTVVCSVFPAEEVEELVASGHPYFTELRGLDATYVDLPTGHWPMLSRPEDLARILLAAAR
ncbi:pimeloyl-ACP methyl ester carboxylesterase [Kineococcus xinjiangensis]|uniref:Pimeloyl-ACP methyl ester carboxylesterase n=1 Tax=Kineococcus xinjiangensis TaxID=512762 RepID=A0A2S6IJ56_9ACTN|nr:alpha/beta hydrolase [Kineococcus xinjiangensis]PPK94249.1 pimeloyl-ACP methyl ester carboxylesterase [Kineococcus xinjiangensis]